MPKADEIPLIDFRVRPPYESFVPSFFRFGYPLDESLGLPAIVRLCFQDSVPSRDQKSFDLFLEEMDEAGVVLAVVTGREGVDNAHVAELASGYPDRFAGFGGVDTSDVEKALREIAGFRKLGFVGAALDNGMASPPRHNDDPELDAIYELCRVEGLLVSMNGSFLLAPDLSYVDPLRIQRVALKFPDLKIIVAHGCWPWVTQVCAVALMCPNVYVMPDLYPHMPEQEGYFEAVRAGLEGQLLYGSSYPAMSLPASARVIRSVDFGLAKDAHRRMFESAATLLGRDPAQLAPVPSKG
jgi:predicted TIM-barrel fold metal-dependent hydrolase